MLLSYFRIIRPVNILLVILSSILAVLITQQQLQSIYTYLAVSLSAGLTAAAGNVINDYYDIKIDLVNKPFRPLPSGLISQTTALRFYFVLNFCALLLALSLNIYCILIVLVVQILLYLYSYKLKKVPLAGNILIAMLTGLVFLYGGAAAGEIKYAIVPAAFAFLINLIRELLKDIEDIKGDTSQGVFTLPAKKSIKFTQRIIFSITVLIILFTFHPYIYGYYSIEFFIIAMVGINPLMVFFLKSLWQEQSTNNLDKLSKLLKLNMLLGLLAIYAGR